MENLEGMEMVEVTTTNEIIPTNGGLLDGVFNPKTMVQFAGLSVLSTLVGSATMAGFNWLAKKAVNSASRRKAKKAAEKRIEEEKNSSNEVETL